MATKIEFIESYIHDEEHYGGGDYKWNDNHGELIRCRDCRHLDPEDKMCYHHKWFSPFRREPDDYCSYGERKEQ